MALMSKDLASMGGVFIHRLQGTKISNIDSLISYFIKMSVMSQVLDGSVPAAFHHELNYLTFLLVSLAKKHSNSLNPLSDIACY
jgi:hypothetical protein